MVQSNGTPGVGREDGLHEEGEMGTGWSPNSQPNWVDVRRGSVSRECKDCIHICCPKWSRCLAADIRNAYLQAPSSQKDYIIGGPEFGLENIGKVALIHRALYGGKSAGRDFRNHLRSCMRYLNFVSCPADPDVWMRLAITSGGSSYYEYILLYTDDTLVISENAEHVLRNELGKHFTLKEESIGPPKIYLGGSVRKVQLDNGVECWSFSSSQYVQAAVKNVEDCLDKHENPNWKLPKKAETPMQTSYRPELDVSPELNASDAVYYMSLIGVLRWMGGAWAHRRVP